LWVSPEVLAGRVLDMENFSARQDLRDTRCTHGIRGGEETSELVLTLSVLICRFFHFRRSNQAAWLVSVRSKTSSTAPNRPRLNRARNRYHLRYILDARSLGTLCRRHPRRPRPPSSTALGGAGGTCGGFRVMSEGCRRPATPRKIALDGSSAVEHNFSVRSAAILPPAS
jgi:hypothetical protein